MALFFIAGSSEDGDTLDLFARAQNPQNAVWFWRKYFELEPEDVPDFVAEVPSVEGPTGPIDWSLLIPADNPLV